MRVLIVKTSSLGDVLHTLPAVTEAAQLVPHVRFDWVVEENFAEVPAWHPQVDEVIPVALRRWRKNLWQAYHSGEWQFFLHQLRAKRYDKIIDAQGLIKSALLVRLAKGERLGFAWDSVREPLASLAYQQRFNSAKNQHAIGRLRELFAKALHYPLSNVLPASGIDKNRLPAYPTVNNYVVFLHGTTWRNKHWPDSYWQDLAKLVAEAGYQLLLPWGNPVEQERAKQLAMLHHRIKVLPKMSLTELAGVLAGARAVVAVDTGLSHLAAALATPTIGLYGPTDPQLTGSVGVGQIHLRADFPCAPCLKRHCTYQKSSEVWPACFSSLTPQQVWQQLQLLL